MSWCTQAHRKVLTCVCVGGCVRPGDSLKIVLMLRFLSPLSPCGFALDPADITKIMPAQSQPSFNHSFQTCQHMPSVPLSYGLALSFLSLFLLLSLPSGISSLLLSVQHFRGTLKLWNAYSGLLNAGMCTLLSNCGGQMFNYMWQAQQWGATA